MSYKLKTDKKYLQHELSYNAVEALVSDHLWNWKKWSLLEPVTYKNELS